MTQPLEMAPGLSGRGAGLEVTDVGPGGSHRGGAWSLPWSVPLQTLACMRSPPSPLQCLPRLRGDGLRAGLW